MKKLITLGVMVFLLSNGTAFADGPFTKIGRGFTNVVTGPGEYLVQIERLRQDNDVVTAIFGGIFKGTAMMFARELGGAYEIVTFLIPIPSDYRPLWEPATVVKALEELKH